MPELEPKDDPTKIEFYEFNITRLLDGVKYGVTEYIRNEPVKLELFGRIGRRDVTLDYFKPRIRNFSSEGESDVSPFITSAEAIKYKLLLKSDKTDKSNQELWSDITTIVTSGIVDDSITQVPIEKEIILSILTGLVEVSKQKLGGRRRRKSKKMRKSKKIRKSKKMRK